MRDDRLHLAGMVLWGVLLVPTLLFWRESVVWLVFMSWYANWVGHWSGYVAGKAEREAEK